MNLPMPVIDMMTRYEDLMLKKRAIEKECEALKPEILEAIPKDAKIETSQGSFAVQSKPKWEYSPMIKADESRLKEAKKREEQDGTAVQVPGEPFLVYRTRGGDDE